MNTQISSLIEDQLPGFITAEYENFTKVLEAYYEQLECPGQPLDIITNITQYRDIDYYEKHLLKERSTLFANISDTDDTFSVADGSSFPEKNGYVKIDNEILFYKERIGDTFYNVSRGVSGTTKLGDLYSPETFISSEASSHNENVNVDNLSHLFLYALTRAFEKEYLESFPEAYLKDDVDKRTLIKNIGNFYKVKGNDKSIRFIFNTIISKSIDDIPTTYNPKDHTLKVSTSDWDSSYGLQTVILSGNPEWLIGEQIVQQSDRFAPNLSYASVNVENVIPISELGDAPLYSLVLNPTSLNGEFVIPQQTILTKSITSSAGPGDKITVDSTFGWKEQEGSIVINGEMIEYSAKSARQFTIKKRGMISQIHGIGDKVYNYSTAKAETANGTVTMLIYGILTRLEVDEVSPYARSNDRIQISKPGFETRDPILYDEYVKNYRWKVNANATSPSVPLNPVIATSLSDTIADISSIYEDDQYYYIATSSYPTTDILIANVSETLVDPNLLKLLPKKTTTTTEVYATPRSDVGILVDGSILYNHKDADLIKYGPITKFNITARGSGYQKPPYVLVNGQSGKASAVLTGDSIDSIITTNTESYTAPPTIDIVSGRNANLQAIVTSGSISSIRIVNPGEYYSSPPSILISDINGRGKFAQYNAILSPQGEIIDAVKVDGGKYYTQEGVRVTVVPDALYSPASATSEIYEWVKNRHFSNAGILDNNGGYVVTNSDNESHYGVVGNPKQLRYRIGDNLTSTTLVETSTLKHSPILGYAYDGHPIYGPYGYTNPLDKNSSIVRLQSGYSLKADRKDGPILDDAPYPMGTFVNDYEWIATIQTGSTVLDRNNGRFCVTPEYPEGVYAYFLTIDENNESVFPYAVGTNYYSIPVTSNYEYNIKQDSIPANAKRLYIGGTLKNGEGEIALIDNISNGSVSDLTIEDSQPIYGVGSKIYVDDSNTDGSGASGYVKTTYGKTVESIESVEVRAVLLETSTPVYSFAGDIITQASTGATGELLRDTIEETSFIIRNVQGEFSPESDISTSGLAASTKTISSSSTVVNLLLSQNSSYTKDYILSLVKKSDTTDIIASGRILSTTADQNSVRVLVLNGNFNDFINYPVGDTILKSTDVSNTAGTEIEVVKQLSKDIVIVGTNSDIAILETDGDHNMAEGDVVNIEVDPDEESTESTYWVRRKRFQELDLIPTQFNGKLNDTGIGSSTLVGYGRDYVAGTYTDVPLIFSSYTTDRDDVVNAKATITVPSTNFDGSGNISSIEITDAGSGYLIDDVLTIDPSAVDKITAVTSSVDIDPTLVLQNGDEREVFQQRKFSVASGDYATLMAALPAPGQILDTDAGDKSIYYLIEDAPNYTITYALFPESDDLTTSDTIGGVALTNVFIDYPPGTPEEQWRFKVGGEENPDYIIRVGSTFTLTAIDTDPIRIVREYTTKLKEDFVAIEVDEYTDAGGVTNNGATTGDIVFTPTYAGEFYYIVPDHAEAVGKITVLGPPNPAIPLLGVNSIGLGVQRTDAVLDTVYSLSEGDKLKINSEIVKIVSIDDTTRKVTFDRGQDNTIITNHPINSQVKDYESKYRFTFNDKVFGNSINDPRVISYNEDTHKLLVAFDFAYEGATNPLKITEVSSFSDHSTPTKLVSISKAYDSVEKLQFSPDNTNFETNPVLQIQKFYFYKFDTSHPSMLGSYLDISTSPNYNIFTEEKEVGLIEPGNTGANIRIRLGYGPNIGNVKRKTVNFISYYYFLTTEDIDTGGSYLSVREDPLAGDRTILYTTPDKFAYSLTGVPQYDGTGQMRYTGKSVGKIATVILDNLGSNYNSVPVVKGVVPASQNKAVIECTRDVVSQSITELTIITPGIGYVKPKAVVSSGDGSGLEIELSVLDGSIVKAEVIKPGSGYTFTPKLDIIETDNKLFFTSKDIGKPQSVKFVRYGSGYHNDSSIIPFFSTPHVYILSDFDIDAFQLGETVEQKVNGLVVASGVVSKNGWRLGSNILRLQNINGVFREGYPIVNKQRGKTAKIVSIEYSKFTPKVNTRETRLGRFTSDRGKVGSANQRITDSDFYQDYSYVIRSRTPIKDWRNAIKDTTHPAGFKVFGEVYIESEASTLMDVAQDHTEKLTTYVIVPPISIDTYTTTRTISQTVLTGSDIQVRRGVGSVAVDAFDETLTRVRELTLSPAFDGDYDPQTGLKIGNRVFTIIDKETGSAYSPYNEQELMITLDGINQEPIKSYTITGNQIKFWEPPLGIRTEGNVEIDAQFFYGRGFKFREDSDNARYLKRIKDISSQFDGRQKNFDLYWEDGSVVKTDLNENLLIYLDSILQQGSYTIRRFVSANKTDRLIFKKAPQNYADIYPDLPQSLENEQYFHAHSVGSYERLHIDEKVIPFNNSNSYLILDENNSVKSFDSTMYAYVFVNGVFQRNIESYRIVGPSIIFHDALKYSKQADGKYVTDKVDILYFYGKDYLPSLTFFDFEADAFYNRTTITFNEKYDEFASWISQSSATTYVYQIIGGVNKVWGKVIEYESLTGTTWSLDIQSQNIEYVDGDKIYFSRSTQLDNPLELTVSSISVSYNTNAAGERLLNRVESNYVPWLGTTDKLDSYDYRGELLKEHPSLKKGDLIKIDGEFDYREVKSTPIFAKSKQYNDGEQVSNSFFSKVTASDYNKDVLGEGFTVTSEISNGVITKLNWNRRDLELYFRSGILLNPTAYNYYTPPVINIIPLDGKGGGAKAEVLVHGGQILDIVLVNGGSGYTKPPKVVIARGYDIIRVNDTFESSFEITLNGSPADAGATFALSEINVYNRLPLEHYVSFVSPQISTMVLLQRQTVPQPNITFKSHTQFITKIITPPLAEPKVMSSTGTSHLGSKIETAPIGASYVSYEHPVTKYNTSGVVDMLEQPVNNPTIYSQGKLGGTVASFMEYLFIDNGAFNVSGINIEQFTAFYPFLAINQNPGNWMENYTIDYSSITSNGVLFNPGVPSIHNKAGYLDSNFDIGDTHMFITGSTTHFPSSGKLLVGREVIEYSGTVNNDRFTISARGVDGTTQENHTGGQYFRTLGRYN